MGNSGKYEFYFNFAILCFTVALTIFIRPTRFLGWIWVGIGLLWMSLASKVRNSK